MQFGTVLDMTIYIDEFQAVEKSDASAVREQTRQRALERTSTALDTIESRLTPTSESKAPLHRHPCRSLESRLLFVRLLRYMESRAWTVKFVETEADVAIAKDATPQDVIISADSDMLGYTTIHTLWRPVTGGLILEYPQAVLLSTLGLSRAQLTTPAVVSCNDYNHPRIIVGRHLSDKRVISKNTTSEDFALSIRVFVDMTQTRTGFQAASQVDALVRFRVPKLFNRYRTVEYPVHIPEDSGAPTQQITQASYNGTSSISSESKDPSHPALARTKIPRHHPGLRSSDEMAT
ncbi:hypothetical protein BGX30_012655 [Mortierella sp. GBA39]|nr:hypothetical protein BGX30_012655 [Mortierella sp. GBA39]